MPLQCFSRLCRGPESHLRVQCGCYDSLQPTGCWHDGGLIQTNRTGKTMQSKRELPVEMTRFTSVITLWKRVIIPAIQLSTAFLRGLSSSDLF